MHRNPTSGLGRARIDLLFIFLLFVFAAACSSGDDDGSSADPVDGDAPGTSESPDDDADDDLVDEPAPFDSVDGVALRVDEVSVESGTMQVRYVLATADEEKIDDEDIELRTNSGIDLPPLPEQDRTYPAGSMAASELSVPLPDDDVTSVRMTLDDIEVSFEVPADGERLRWAPAPLRQVGFDDVVMTDDSTVSIVPYTFRTEGLVSEVTFLLATGATRSGTDVCIARGCRLEDGDGGVYPLLGEGHELERSERTRGTLRFLGEIPPDEADLRLVIAGRGATVVSPDPLLEHAFILPSAPDSATAVEASSTFPETIEVGERIDGEDGRSIELGALSFHEDRLQLDVRIVGGENGFELDPLGNAAIIEPSGFHHPLLGPTEDPDVFVGAGEELEITLVFLRRMTPDTDSLRIRFQPHTGRVETTVELPDEDGR